MKKIISILLIFVWCAILAGCNNDSTDFPELNIIKAESQISATGGETVIQIQSTSATVKAVSEEEWCKVVEATAESIKLSIERNDHYPGRSVRIVITDGTNTQYLTIIQEGALLIYNSAELTQRSNNQASELPIELSASFPLEISIPEKDKNWLSFEFSKENQTGTFKLRENTSGAPRGTLVQIKSGNRSVYYQVLQYNASDFIGDWKGQYISQGRTYSLPKVSISNPDEKGMYTISGLFSNSTYNYLIKASYQNSAYVINNAQPVGSFISGMSVLDAYLCIIDNTSYPWWNSNYSINLAPVLLVDGSMALEFIDNGSTPAVAAGISFSGFTRTPPSSATFVGPIRTLQNCILFK